MIYKKNHMEGSIERVYRYLFDQIINNHLKPGEALSEVEIATAMSSSRTPVREALTLLESEGLVRRYPRRGCFVAEVTIDDLEEIFELRINMEVCALRKSYGLISNDELSRLEKDLLSLKPDSKPKAYYDSDRALHSLIIQNCGNGRLVDFLGILNAQIERLRYISAMKPERLPLSRNEHLQIVRAMQSRDLSLAEKLLTSHIEHVRDSTRDVCRYLNNAEHAVFKY